MGGTMGARAADRGRGMGARARGWFRTGPRQRALADGGGPPAQRGDGAAASPRRLPLGRHRRRSRPLRRPPLRARRRRAAPRVQLHMGAPRGRGGALGRLRRWAYAGGRRPRHHLHHPRRAAGRLRPRARTRRRRATVGRHVRRRRVPLRCGVRLLRPRRGATRPRREQPPRRPGGRVVGGDRGGAGALDRRPLRHGARGERDDARHRPRGRALARDGRGAVPAWRGVGAGDRRRPPARGRPRPPHHGRRAVDRDRSERGVPVPRRSHRPLRRRRVSVRRRPFPPPRPRGERVGRHKRERARPATARACPHDRDGGGAAERHRQRRARRPGGACLARHERRPRRP